MKTKRDKLDAIFSQLVRERAGWRCEKCGRDFKDNPRALHCSHLWGRRRKSVRFLPANAAAHCFSCHQYLGEHPVEFAAWIEEHLGESFEDVRQLAGQTLKVSKVYREEIYQRMKESLAAMQEQRAAGVEGRIEFDSPYGDV